MKLLIMLTNELTLFTTMPTLLLAMIKTIKMIFMIIMNLLQTKNLMMVMIMSHLIQKQKSANTNCRVLNKTVF